MWNVEETVKINKDPKRGWGWPRLGLTEASERQLQAAEATLPGHTADLPDTAQLCPGHRESSAVAASKLTPRFPHLSL